METQSFQQKIYSFFIENGRVFPWRETRNPYRILVSEIMLQQTQAPRVVAKYESWITRFPTPESVARSSVQEILEAWLGLGYNRRALNLKRTCEVIVNEQNGKVPKKLEDLIALPGIGPYTARAVRAFAWNEPEVFIETNIRSVFIHFFFRDQEEVHDRDILPLIEKTLNRGNPREWYWALMDYGAHLKRAGNPSRKSAHHTRQSIFKGSNREQRAFILKMLTAGKKTKAALEKLIETNSINSENLDINLLNLTREGFIEKIGRTYQLKD